MLGHTQDNVSFILNLLLLIPTEKALLKKTLIHLFPSILLLLQFLFIGIENL